jgi:beta-phosphoglucomutase
MTGKVERTQWGVIFDSDGVLVDTEQISLQAFVSAVETLFADVSYTVSEEDILRNCGLSDRDICDYFKRSYGLEAELEEFVALKRERYLQLAAEREIRVFPGVRELLAELEQAGTPFALASSGAPEKIHFNLERAGLTDRFQVIVSAEEFARGKPDPALFLGAAERLGVKPERCVVLEDSLNGVRAAQAAGMACLAVTNTFPAKSLAEADLVVDSLTHVRAADLEHLVMEHEHVAS